MVKSRLTLLVLALVFCASSVEARGGRRGMQQPVYTQYYNVAPAANVVYQAAPAATTTPAPAGTVTQASATEPANKADGSSSVVTAGAATTTNPAPAAAPAAVGSAQWKAEQSARFCSVAHLGGGFGGGSYEGNGFGATAQQAIQNCCYWGQRTPIQIGVARGANGYYATVFYR